MVSHRNNHSVPKKITTFAALNRILWLLLEVLHSIHWVVSSIIPSPHRFPGCLKTMVIRSMNFMKERIFCDQYL